MATFKDKTVLVTGGAEGIGFLMGKKSLQQGARHLIIWDINKESIQSAVDTLTSLNFSVSAATVDVSDPEAVKTNAEKVLTEYGNVDILFNNAGIIVGKPFHEHSVQDIQRTMGVNTLAFMYVTNAFLPSMMERNSGHIIAITSSAGLTPNPGMVVYVASKWAAVGWVESLRLEVRRTHPGIKFLNVMPGYIGTKMFAGVTPPRLLPLLDPERITNRIIDYIKRERRTLRAPVLVKFTTFIRGLLPAPLYDFIADKVLNVYSSMNTFQGK